MLGSMKLPSILVYMNYKRKISFRTKPLISTILLIRKLLNTKSPELTLERVRANHFLAMKDHLIDLLWSKNTQRQFNSKVSQLLRKRGNVSVASEMTNNSAILNAGLPELEDVAHINRIPLKSYNF